MSRPSLAHALLLASSASCLWTALLRPGLSFLHAPHVGGDVPVSGRRAALLPLASSAAAWLACDAPASATALDLYRGRLEDLRNSLDWYRFDFGDLVASMDGSSFPDFLKPEDRKLMLERQLDRLTAVLTPQGARGGTPPASALDRGVVAPMLLMALSPALDPDSAEDAESRVRAFQRTLLELRASSKRLDADGCQRLYDRSLSEMNAFLAISNAGLGAQQGEEMWLPPLPLDMAELEGDKYWLRRRRAFLDFKKDAFKRSQELNPATAAVSGLVFALR